MLVSRLIGPRQSIIEEAPDPTPQPGEVVVDVVSSGVCTSDLGAWREGHVEGEHIVLGHEIVGRVAAIGDGVKRWKIGETVTGLGLEGFAEKARLRADRILPVPAGVDPVVCLGEPFADVEEAVARCGITESSRVAIVGLGYMGLIAVNLVALRTPARVVGVDPLEAARAHATRMGADETMTPEEAMNRFDPGQTGNQTFDVVLEVTGSAAGLKSAEQLVPQGGTLSVIGYHHKGMQFDLGLWYKGATLVFGFSGDPRRLMRAMDDVLVGAAARRVLMPELLTHTFGLEGVNDAFELMERRPAGFIKSAII